MASPLRLWGAGAAGSGRRRRCRFALGGSEAQRGPRRLGPVLGTPGGRGRGAAEGPETAGSSPRGERRGGWNPAGRRKSPRSLPFRRPSLFQPHGRSPQRPTQLWPRDRPGVGRSGIFFFFSRKRLAPSARRGDGLAPRSRRRLGGPRGAACAQSPHFWEGGTRCLAEPPCPLLPTFCLSFLALSRGGGQSPVLQRRVHVFTYNSWKDRR